MMRNKKTLGKILIALSVLLLTWKVVDLLVMSSFGTVFVEMESDRNTKVQLYYSAAGGDAAFFSKQQSSRRQYLAGGERQRVRFEVHNRIVRTLRLDPGINPGTYRIYSVELRSFFGSPVSIDMKDPSLQVLPGLETTIERKDNCLEVTSTGKDPSIVFNRELRVTNPTIEFLVPGLVALLAFVIAGRFRLSSCTFLKDVTEKKPSSGKNLDCLDGLRGMAALIVLAGHAGFPGCEGIVMVGVVIFFCLSGFLLTLPFAADSSRILSTNYVQEYFMRRLARILPMYYAVLTASYLFSLRVEDFVRSLLFLQGNTILWTVLQEIHFYVLLPLIFLFFHFVLRGRTLLIVSTLFLLGFAYNHDWLPVHTMYGMGQNIRLFVGIFFVGVVAGYLFQVKQWQEKGKLVDFISHPFVISAVFLLMLTIPELRNLLEGHRVVESWVLRGNFSYLAGFLILALAIPGKSFVHSFFASRFLRCVGVVSYSFYLLHPLILQVIKQVMSTYFNIVPHGVTKFCLALVFTFLASAITYTWIERPMSGRSR